MTQKYLCHTCHTMGFTDPKCPKCGDVQFIQKMCPEDHECTCSKDITEGYRTCPVCDEFICPCGAHNVFVVSRVKKDKLCAFLCPAGYLSDVSGWRSHKVRELKDRKRYDIR